MADLALSLASQPDDPDKTELQWGSLSDKERQTLLAMLTSKDDAEAIQRSPVGKTQFYAHKKKLEPYKQELVNGLLGKALEVLQANSIKASERLVELLDSPHPKTRQLAAESILDRSIGKPTATEHTQPKPQLTPIVLVGVPQEKLDRLFIPKQYEQETVVEGESVLNVETA